MSKNFGDLQTEDKIYIFDNDEYFETNVLRVEDGDLGELVIWTEYTDFHFQNADISITEIVYIDGHKNFISTDLDKLMLECGE